MLTTMLTTQGESNRNSDFLKGKGVIFHHEEAILAWVERNIEELQ